MPLPRQERIAGGQKAPPELFDLPKAKATTEPIGETRQPRGAERSEAEGASNGFAVTEGAVAQQAAPIVAGYQPTGREKAATTTPSVSADGAASFPKGDAKEACAKTSS